MALTTLLMGCVAPALAADSPVNDAYGNTGSSLPFSGLDLGLIAAGGRTHAAGTRAAGLCAPKYRTKVWAALGNLPLKTR